MWGASLTAFNRLLSPIYEDGFSMPVGELYDGKIGNITGLLIACKVRVQIAPTEIIGRN